MNKKLLYIAVLICQLAWLTAMENNTEDNKEETLDLSTVDFNTSDLSYTPLQSPREQPELLKKSNYMQQLWCFLCCSAKNDEILTIEYKPIE